MQIRVCQLFFERKKARQFLTGHLRHFKSLFYSFANQSRFIFCCSIRTLQHYGIFVIFFGRNENTHDAIQNFMSRIQAAKTILSPLDNFLKDSLSPGPGNVADTLQHHCIQDILSIYNVIALRENRPMTIKGFRLLEGPARNYAEAAHYFALEAKVSLSAAVALALLTANSDPPPLLLKVCCTNC